MVGPLRVDVLTEQDLLDRIDAMVADRSGGLVTYTHLHTLALAVADPRVAELINDFDVCYCDGLGVAHVSSMLNRQWIPKVTANAYIGRLLELARRRGWRVAMVGGAPDVVAEARRRIAARGVDVVHAHHGFLDAAETRAVRRALQELRPDLVLVGLGQSTQERFAVTLAPMVRGAVIVCVGGLFDFVAGRELPCPPLVRRLGFEWAVRLASDPTRLWHRYLVEGPALILRALLLRRL